MNSAPQRRSWPRRILNRIEVDQAVFYALVLRGWQLGAGVVSLLLIARFFTGQTQGFYYTFGSLAALQTLFELGFTVAVINLSSHEWAHLRLNDRGEAEGDAAARSRLASLSRFLSRWYSVAAILYVVGVGLAGAAFLSTKDSSIEWRAPWAVTVALTGLSLWSLPFMGMLEGCGQAATVSRFRAAQGIIATLAIWGAMISGLGLWAAAAAAGSRAACDLFLLFGRRRRFFRSLRTRDEAAGPPAEMSWKDEVWPLQWRMAVQGALGYLSFGLLVPVMFKYFGETAAGRMGMTWSVVSVVQAACFAWVQARAGLLGTLAAKREFKEFDRVFFRVEMVSLAVFGVAGAAVCAGVIVIGLAAPSLAARMLPILPTALLTLAVMIYHIPHCQSIYVRAHKQDPFLLYGVITNLSIGLLIWLGGMNAGETGAATGFLAAVTLVSLPMSTWIWSRCRAERRIGPAHPRQKRGTLTS